MPLRSMVSANLAALHLRDPRCGVDNGPADDHLGRDPESWRTLARLDDGGTEDLHAAGDHGSVDARSSTTTDTRGFDLMFRYRTV